MEDALPISLLQMETVKVENPHITRLLEEHTLLITQNVNIVSLKRYLIQYHCIGLMDEERLTRGSQHDNNLELMKIISARGRGAFEGFLHALEHSVREDPGEKGHEELGNILKMAYINKKRKLSREVSRTKSITSISSHSSLLISSVDSHPQLEIASLPKADPMLDKDMGRQPPPLDRGSQEPDGEESTPPLTVHPPTEVHISVAIYFLPDFI